MDRVALWVAEGFGVGKIPIAPGTFGSLLGIGWVALLLVPGQLWIYAAGCLVGVSSSVFFCGRAERVLGKTDPGSVVLDEIAAMPVCFAGWVWMREMAGTASLGLFDSSNLTGVAAIFAAFRVFDVVKPWPVRQSQSLPGGWGVTTDDVLAGVYVNLCYFAFVEFHHWAAR